MWVKMLIVIGSCAGLWSPLAVAANNKLTLCNRAASFYTYKAEKESVTDIFYEFYPLEGAACCTVELSFRPKWS